jgi:hypothetical protein
VSYGPAIPAFETISSTIRIPRGGVLIVVVHKENRAVHSESRGIGNLLVARRGRPLWFPREARRQLRVVVVVVEAEECTTTPSRTSMGGCTILGILMGGIVVEMVEIVEEEMVDRVMVEAEIIA